MMVDETKAFITLASGEKFQALDESGELDQEATQALIEEYLAEKEG